MRKAPTTQLSAGQNDSIAWKPTRDVNCQLPLSSCRPGACVLQGLQSESWTRHTTHGVEVGPGSLMHFLIISIIFLHKTQQNTSGWL